MKQRLNQAITPDPLGTETWPSGELFLYFALVVAWFFGMKQRSKRRIEPHRLWPVFQRNAHWIEQIACVQ
jgi:hypothetical protein